jgi:hypothetical protein
LFLFCYKNVKFLPSLLSTMHSSMGWLIIRLSSLLIVSGPLNTHSGIAHY